ncbi:Geranylgeranyl transferase type-2 subunit alpha [Trichuris trichiura]|uniref:Geranylgeranyl transferase type-2 subunit alpha n=1 Tax=Trichuris trichiura TaxID=36087 RepID=A0A077Z297_TRITR|nr:Geranylgeranyl transferase type-2 subunit alpha [Trichuris trichiura]
MHGRKRNVIRADETDAEKERQQQKVDLYRKARDTVFGKIKTGIKGVLLCIFLKHANVAGFDAEAMDVSKAILSSNPDFTTLWNHRRKYLLQLLLTDDRDETDSGKCGRKLLEAELRLTEACLLKNPKSYSAWHHRYWAFSRMQSPDFASEFALIDSALQEDDRNFHCWDYRRLICSLAKRPPEEELEFSEKKVNDNFSNFSAWHYRSKMLSQLRPSDEAGMPVQLDTFFDELALSHNGIFTDPDDQSCWLYQNWLTTPPVGGITIQRISVSTTSGVVVLCFNQAVSADMFNFTLQGRVSCSDDFRWTSPDNATSSRLWYSQLSSDYAIDNFHCVVEIVDGGSCTEIRLDDMVAFDQVRYWHVANCKQPKEVELPETVKTALTENLSDIEKLILMEPENHWALVSAVMRMDVIGRNDYAEKMVEYLDKAMELDRKRMNFYLYWKNSLLFDTSLRNHLAVNRDVPTIDLSSKGLSFLTICSDIGFLTQLNISGNSLQSIAPLSCLLHLRQLLAKCNRISSMRGLENLIELEIVDLTDNCIDIDGFLQLSNCKRLASLLLRNNPICQNAEFKNLPIFHGSHFSSPGEKNQTPL